MMTIKLQISLIFLVFLPIFGNETMAFLVNRRSAVPEPNSDDYPDYMTGIKYDEYPVS